MVGSIVMLVFQGVNEVTLVVGDRYFLRPFLGSFTPNGPKNSRKVQVGETLINVLHPDQWFGKVG